MKTSNLSSILCVASAAAVGGVHLNITAVTAHHNTSLFECWQLETPFVTSKQPGLEGSAKLDLGAVTNISYSVLPAGYIEPLHNAPVPQ